VGKLTVTYRLPSIIVLQLAPLPDLTCVIEGRTVTVHEPSLDSQLSVPSLWSAYSASPRYRYGDILNVDVEVAVPTDEQERLSVSRPILLSLEPVLQRLLLLIQVVGKQYWLGYQALPLFWLRHPARYTLADDEGQRSGFGSGGLGEPTIDEAFWLTENKWSAIGQFLAQGQDPPLPRILYQEAWGFWSVGNLRSAILSGAVACEAAIKTYIREVHGAREPIYSYIVDRDRELSIFDYLDDVLEMATGHSTKDALKHEVGGGLSAYTLLRQMFEVRNKIAHEGRAYRRVNRQEIMVDEQMVNWFLTSASGLLSWLENLRGPAGDDP